jgi:hypothetical protein
LSKNAMVCPAPLSSTAVAGLWMVVVVVPQILH